MTLAPALPASSEPIPSPHVGSWLPAAEEACCASWSQAACCDRVAPGGGIAAAGAVAGAVGGAALTTSPPSSQPLPGTSSDPGSSGRLCVAAKCPQPSAIATTGTATETDSSTVSPPLPSLLPRPLGPTLCAYGVWAATATPCAVMGMAALPLALLSDVSCCAISAKGSSQLMCRTGGPGGAALGTAAASVAAIRAAVGTSAADLSRTAEIGGWAGDARAVGRATEVRLSACTQARSTLS